MFKNIVKLAAISLLTTASASYAQSAPESKPEMNHTTPSNAQNPVQVQRGNFYQFVVPAGWKLGEEGQHAVTLVAPDGCALTMMVGNTGLQPGFDPAQFVSAKLSMLQNPTLRIGQPRPARPMQGFTSAVSFEYVYSVNGVPCRGLATCSLRDWYGGRDMVMTAAASTEAQWASYANWLPQVAMQCVAVNSHAMGARGIAQQNLQISTAEGERARQAREFAAAQAAEIARQRALSQDRNNQQFRDTLGNATPYENPYTQREEELSSSNAVYWINAQGQIVGDPNPSFDPRTATDPNWQRLQPSQRR